jgi:hypothetical protein
MKINVAARRAVAAVALSASTVAGFGAAAVGTAAVANATPVAEHKAAPIGFCTVFGGELPIIGRLPFCKKPPAPMPGPLKPPTLPGIPGIAQTR